MENEKLKKIVNLTYEFLECIVSLKYKKTKFFWFFDFKV